MSKENAVPPAVELALSSLKTRLLGWVMPALVGALLMNLITASGERALTAQHQREIDETKVRVTNIETNLAGGGPPALSRRVDDLQQQVNSEMNRINNKLDDVLALLVKRPNSSE